MKNMVAQYIATKLIINPLKEVGAEARGMGLLVALGTGGA